KTRAAILACYKDDEEVVSQVKRIRERYVSAPDPTQLDEAIRVGLRQLEAGPKEAQGAQKTFRDVLAGKEIGQYADRKVTALLGLARAQARLGDWEGVRGTLKDLGSVSQGDQDVKAALEVLLAEGTSPPPASAALLDRLRKLTPLPADPWMGDEIAV